MHSLLAVNRTRIAISLLAVPLALVSLTADAAPWNKVDAAVFEDTGEYWSRDVELVDLDGDGYVDILFANVGGVFEGTDDSDMPNQAYHNDAGAAFTDVTASVFGDGTDTARVIKSCDVDNDGDQDLIIGNTWDNQSRLLRNDGGTFSDVTDTAFPVKMASVGDVECGDVDEDGDLDLVLTNWGPNPVNQLISMGGVTMLWLNDGAGTFSDATAAQMPDVLVNYSLDVDFVDVDNDYDLDLALACQGCIGGSLLYLNDGLGLFTPATPAAFSEVGTIQLEAMDLNDDGFLDMITLGDGQGGMEGVRNRILVNDGLGDFVDETLTYWPLIENPGSGDRGVGFLDYDSDGDLDIVLGTNASLQWPDRLMINDEGVYYQEPMPFGMDPGTEGTLALESVDLNGDHRPDLVLGSGENAFVNAVLFGDEADTAVDITPPALAHIEQVEEAPFPGSVDVHARIHDYKTPNKPHDWEKVYIEWAEGNVSAEYLEMNGTQEDGFWYGENMWLLSYEVPDIWESTYRICAIDIAQNIACSDVTVVGHPGGNLCGNDVCDDGENNNNCPEDCEPMCGNNVVEMGEQCDDDNDPQCVDCMTVDTSASDTSDTDNTITDTETDSDSSNTNSETDSDGGMCIDDSDCPDGQICVDGLCVPDDATESATDSGTLGLDDDGCDCSANDDGRNALGALALLVIAGLGRRRRR